MTLVLPGAGSGGSGPVTWPWNANHACDYSLGLEQRGAFVFNVLRGPATPVLELVGTSGGGAGAELKLRPLDASTAGTYSLMTDPTQEGIQVWAFDGSAAENGRGVPEGPWLLFGRSIGGTDNPGIAFGELLDANIYRIDPGDGPRIQTDNPFSIGDAIGLTVEDTVVGEAAYLTRANGTPELSLWPSDLASDTAKAFYIQRWSGGAPVFEVHNDSTIVASSPNGTRYTLRPPNGGGAATWVAE